MCSRTEMPRQSRGSLGLRTILIHCNDSLRLPRLLHPGVTLCRIFSAHLVGVSVTPPIAVIAAGMPGALDFIVVDKHAKAYQAENPAMKEAFERAANTQNVTAEWREEDAGSSTVGHVMVRHARTADLVIASQTGADLKGSLDLDVPDRLALESGRPDHSQYGIATANRQARRHRLDRQARGHACDVRGPSSPAARRHGDGGSGGPGDPARSNGKQMEICATLTRHGVTCKAEDATCATVFVFAPQLGRINPAQGDITAKIMLAVASKQMAQWCGKARRSGNRRLAGSRAVVSRSQRPMHHHLHNRSRSSLKCTRRDGKD